MRMMLAMSAVAAAMLAGCASIEVSREFCGTAVNGNRQPKVTVSIENSGWYFLGFIPIVTGDPANPNGCSFRMFTDTVSLENNIKMLQAQARIEGAYNVANLMSVQNNHLSIGFFILGMKSMYTSAVITKAEGDSSAVQLERLNNALEE